MRSLTVEIGEPPKARGEAIPITGEASALFGKRCQPIARRREQLLLLHELLHLARVELQPLVIERDRRVELGVHLEDLEELGVLMREHVEGARLTDQHDLDVDRDRRRQERRRRFAATAIQAADLQLLALERDLELLPDTGLLQHIGELEDQVAALGAQEATTVNLTEARHLATAEDAPEDVLPAGVRLVEHRAAGLDELAGRLTDTRRCRIRRVERLALERKRARQQLDLQAADAALIRGLDGLIAEGEGV
jgi:PHD/YefM family antitoxin component YafN of YafNO toxin-antitoxin module